MKLILYADINDTPPRCTYKYSYSCVASGNPFSDEKSARTLIERVSVGQFAVALHHIVVHIRDVSSIIIGIYVVDVP